MMRRLRKKWKPVQKEYDIWKIVKGDLVHVISGTSKGKEGAVLEVLRKSNSVIIEDVNLKTKVIDPASPDKKANVGKVPFPVHISKVALVDPTTGVPTKVRFGFLEDGTKARISKKSGCVIPKPEIPVRKFTFNELKDTKYSVVTAETVVEFDYEGFREEYRQKRLAQMSAASAKESAEEQ